MISTSYDKIGADESAGMHLRVNGGVNGNTDRASLGRSCRKIPATADATASLLPGNQVRSATSPSRRKPRRTLHRPYLALAPVDIDELIDRFGLSAEAAAIRKAEIEAIRRRRAGEKRPLPKSVLDFLSEAKRRGRIELDER
jgi:hypothetical protein